MPVLNWIGKEAVVKHHKEVPFRLLEPVQELSCGDVDSGNLIVEGDNLHALKALLPRYAGQVKCIYIDPPYNTGNEGWAYNDNVKSPEILKWLGEVVGREGETLDRHDRWLCMMYPRLLLLKQFLREDGVILISIDDFEAHNLRILMDEIFGGANFIAQLIWDKTRKNDAKLLSVGHEYLLVFAKSLRRIKELKTVWREQKPGAKDVIAKWKELRVIHSDQFSLIENDLKQWYKSLPKNNPAKKLSRTWRVDENGPWRDRDISWPGGGGPRYDVIHPVTRLPCKVPERGWIYSKPEEMQRQIDLGLVVFRDDHTDPPMRKAHLLPVADEVTDYELEPEDIESETGEEDEEDAGLQVMQSIIQKQAQVSVKLLRQIFGGKKVFQNPKDHEVIARLVRYVSGPEDLILDSFGGSGTTGHAVLSLNAEDGGNRMFILVEIDEKIARDVTAERVRRVANGYKKINGEKVAGLGGSFQYCRLSEEPLFEADGPIRDSVTFAELGEFVWFMETGSGMRKPARSKGKSDSPLLGIHNGRAVFLLFNGILKDKTDVGGNVLNTRTLETLNTLLPDFEGDRVVYGARTRFDKNRLIKLGITFHQLPYDLAKITWF